MLAFEERYSDSQNEPLGEEIFRSFGQEKTRKERAGYFERSESIGSVQPTRAVLLVAITELAIYLCRSKSRIYVAQLVQRSKKEYKATRYVSRIDWEFHFDALDLWREERLRKHEVVARENVLHPAVVALFECAASVARIDIARCARVTREEYENLDDGQIRRNLTAQSLREWYALPSSKERVQNWSTKIASERKKFLVEWEGDILAEDCILVRADLHHASCSTSWSHNFGQVSRADVIEHVRELEKLLRADNRFCLVRCLIDPYLDLNGNWHVPVALLVRRSTLSIPVINLCVLDSWTVAVKPYGGSQSSLPNSLDMEYRFIAPEQRSLDGIRSHLVRLATYIFDTRLIADTRLETLLNQEDKPCARG